MKIGYLGAGAWGFALSTLLAKNGHEVIQWTSKPEFADLLNREKTHPKLTPTKPLANLTFTSDLSEALDGVDFIIESVTSAGFRPVLEKVLALKKIECPFIITSKGIEQNTGLLLTEVALEILGEGYKNRIGCLNGPSLADQVVRELPTSVVSSSYD